MTRGILLSLLVAHLAADFVLQTRGIVEAKCQTGLRRLQGLVYHGLAHLLCGAVLLVGRWTSPVLLALSGVVLAHVLIDWLKSRHERHKPLRPAGIWTFLIDQFLHLAVILVAVRLLSLGEKWTMPPSIQALADGLAGLPNAERILCVAAVALAGLWGTGAGIRVYFADKNRGAQASLPAAGPDGHISERAAPEGGGFTIGVLERSIIILALLLRQEGLIGFLLAVKSIARFKKFNDDCFIEYFIIGSSLSLLAAIVAGWVIRGLLFGH